MFCLVVYAPTLNNIMAKMLQNWIYIYASVCLHDRCKLLFASYWNISWIPSHFITSWYFITYSEGITLHMDVSGSPQSRGSGWLIIIKQDAFPQQCQPGKHLSLCNERLTAVWNPGTPLPSNNTGLVIRTEESETDTTG